jgi:tetratricopeptide (TPR) repeat protein
MKKSVQEGLLQALKKEKSERASFLDSYCAGDTELRRSIDELLPGYEQIEEDLDRPALGQASTVRAALQAEETLTGARMGAYELEREIGRGGMGVVYLGHRADRLYEKQVAIKLVARQTFSPGVEERFRREIQLLASLEHPNIARLIEGGVTDDGISYLVMQYVDGAPLDRYCEEHSLTIRERLRLFQRVCEGVQFAHQNLIIHRDLKPKNILVSADGTPHLLDFGIAKLLNNEDADATQALTGNFLTPDFASPEQVTGGRMTTATDVYSLGVILYELLTFQRPYNISTRSLDEILRAVCIDTPAAPSQKSGNRALRGDLDAIVMKALRKEPESRYLSAQSLSVDIERYLSGQPVEAARGTTLYRWRKFARRHRAAVLAGGAAAAAVFTGLIVATWEAGIARHERGLEEQERIHAQAEATKATEQGRIARDQRSIAEKNAAEAMKQKQKADTRFDDVRRLATSFLFEFDSAIANVAGATEARRLVVAQGLEYLDKLAQDSRGDDSLQREIASAYERLAAIQGNVYSSNLGQNRQAMESYEKALVIRKKLAPHHPADASYQRDLGSSYVQAADGWFTSGDTKTSIAYHRQGIKILGSLAKSGDQSPAVQNGLQSSAARLCSLLLTVGDRPGALENCDIAVHMTQARVSAHPDDPLARAALAAAYGQNATVLRMDNRPKEAIPLLERAASEFEKLVAAQPNNNGYGRNLAGVYSVLGSSQVAAGQTREAVESFEKSVATVRHMIQVDPVDARAKTTLAVSLIRLAPLLLKADRRSDAVAAGREGLEIFRAFADRPEATPIDLNEYASFLEEIGIPELRDPPKALSYSKRAVATAKQPSLVLLSTLADAYFDAGDVENAVATAQRALAENPAPKGPEAGVRADLEKSLQKYLAARSVTASALN